MAQPPDADSPRDDPDQQMAAPDEAALVDADALVADIARPAIGRTFLISLAAHVVVILLTSIQFIYLCARHNTLDPRGEIRRMEQEERERKQDAERKAARERMLAEQARKKAKAKPAPGKESGEGTAGDKEKPKVLRDLDATSKERPTESDVRLNELDDLE